jgi:hypothetical protein
MDRGRIVKEIPENKPDGGRRFERPRLRWFEDVGNIDGSQSLKYCDRRQRTGKNGRR